jgi:eukaryotic-like serine/threonine-protein kinase
MQHKRIEPLDSEGLPTMAASMDQGQGSSLGDFARAFDLPEPPLPVYLGRYHIQREIARGGMGIILHAYDELLCRDVAIKLLLARYAENSILFQRFVNEALVTCRLQHPCIVPIYEHGHAEDERPYFAMKLVTGQSLGKILGSPPSNQTDRSRLFKIFEHVCRAIAYAHSQGVLHLDLKPANIMVGEFGEVYVMDWGLSRVLERSDGMGSETNAENLIAEPLNAYSVPSYGIRGTPAYMAPEQARGLALCPQSDVFGLGAMLCEILTGRPPYRNRDPRRTYADATRAKLDDAHRGLDACASDDRLIQLAKRCLAPNPKDRPNNASFIANEISSYLESALEQSETDLCRFFDLSLDLFCIATIDGYFRRVNCNFPRVLGYSVEQLVSQPFLDFVHPNDKNPTMHVMADLLAGKPVVHFCNRYRHSAGHYITLEWTAKSIVEENTIFAVARDITKRAS